MRKAISLWLAIAAFAGQVPVTIQAQSPQPKGRVYELPIENTFVGGRAMEIGSTSKSVGYLAMPFQLDTEGTLTLTVNLPNETRTLSGVLIQRDDLPKELHFLCGESPSLFVSSRPTYQSTYGQSNPPATLEISYNRNHIPAARKLQLVDIENTPLPADRFHLELSNSSIGIQEINMEISADGLVPLHIISPVAQAKYSLQGNQRPTNNNFTLKDKYTNLLYSFSLHDEGQTSLTRIILPLALNPDQVSSTTKLISGQVLTSNGEPQPALLYIESNTPYKERDRRDWLADPAEKKVTSFHTNANGQFTIASNTSLLQVNVHLRNFEMSYRPPTFTLDSNSTNPLLLPMRINLPFECTDENGTPIRLQSKSSSHVLLQILRYTKMGLTEANYETIVINTTESTGTVYTINLPVPGRYMLKHDGDYYGPVYVKDTTPTEPLRIPVNKADGAKGAAK